MNEIKQIAGILLIAFAITMPMALFSDDIKIWLKVWGVCALSIVVMSIGIALLGVI